MKWLRVAAHVIRCRVDPVRGIPRPKQQAFSFAQYYTITGGRLRASCPGNRHRTGTSARMRGITQVKVV